ncbi:MAG: hypothetical protein ACOC1G_03160 [Phycisphaeraceae bacterium]
MSEHTLTLPPPPPGSSASMDRDGDRVALDLPAVGMWRGSFGLVIFGPALILVAVVSIFRIVTEEGGISPWLLLWFIVLGLIGVLMFLLAQFLGLRATRIECTPEQLTLTNRHVFGSSRVQVPREELDRVVVGEAPFTARNHPVVRLEVWKKDGSRHVSMTARRPAEVAWVADVISEVMQASPNTGAGSR